MRYWSRSITLIEGCTPISESCLNCWSASMYHRFHGNDFLCMNGKWTGEIIIRTDRLPELIKGKKSQVISIWNDLFHEKISDAFIYAVFKTMYCSPDHIFLVLTKRAKRFLEWENGEGIALTRPFPNNIYLGITAENQQRLEERLPYLLQVNGNRFISIEPILSEINLLDFQPAVIFVNQLICGAETGHHARPANLDWFRSIRDQCKEAGIPLFIKNIGKKYKPDMSDWPEDLRVRELAWKL